MSIDSLLHDLAGRRLASRIWARERAAFVGAEAPPAVGDAILNRLGWLRAPEEMTAHEGEIRAFLREMADEGLTDIYLLGMGGSSLCSEVLRDMLRQAGHPNRLTVLDTTDEHAVTSAADSLIPAQSCFIVASKSGSTLEVTSLERYFRSVMEAAVPSPGRHFVAITDPGTELVAHAEQQGYRHTFINPQDIGGRYSALSLFGLVPAALVGIDPGALLGPAREIAAACRADAPSNPGLQLGAFMGGHAADGRDKLTIVASDAFEPLGAWIEQLVAESTGKLGRGVLPVVGEPLGNPDDYGSDRAFVFIMTPGDDALAASASTLESGGHPVFRIEASASALGAEFFRWEFATAVAGAVLGLNPFDEPDVRSAKTRTQAQLDVHLGSGHFRTDPAFVAGPVYARRDQPGAAGDRPEQAYVAILDYLPADPTRVTAITQLRTTLRHRLKVATTHGIGPRYLHSTGQYHKGGRNSGIFVILTSGDRSDTPVPGAGYSFSALKQAQAFGDFDALAAGGRRVIHCHFEDPSADHVAGLREVFDTLR